MTLPTSVCVDGSSGASLTAGYVVDSDLQTPVLGTPFLMDGVARGNASCGDDVSLEFFLPLGARLAIDATMPVQCFVIDPQNNTAPLDLTSPGNRCFQSPSVGIDGSLTFGRISGLPKGWRFEVQVPIIISSHVDLAPLTVRARTLYDNLNTRPLIASIGADVPFQPEPSEFARGDDLVLIGAFANDGIGVAFSNDDGSFTVTNRLAGNFPALSREPNVRQIEGDFDADGLTDFALIGGANWNQIPIAFGNGDQSFRTTSAVVPDFAWLYGQPSATVLAGDFNGDHRTDLALVGGPGWSTIPVAFSNGDGTFNVTNEFVPAVPQQLQMVGARPLVGDFNKDGIADIAVVGAQGQNNVWIAYSMANGMFNLTVSAPWTPSNWAEPSMPLNTIANEPEAQVIAADFNKDGWTDFVVSPGPTYRVHMYVATNIGGGHFDVRPMVVPNFWSWSRMSGAKLIVKDFNGDGFVDMGLVGGQGWNTLPVAINIGGACRSCADFSVHNNYVGDFAYWAQQPGVRITTGDFDGDRQLDIALTGVVGWTAIPVAFHDGNGLFRVTNASVSRFPSWSTPKWQRFPKRVITPTTFSGQIDY